MSVWTKCLTVTTILAFAILTVGREQQSTAIAAAPVAQGVTIGVNFNCLGASISDQATVYGDFRDARVGWVRIYLPWFPIEPKPGQYDTGVTGTLARFESCVDQARAAGFHVLVVFLNNPSWASRAWNTPPNPRTYASTLGYLARRYPQVSAWEVWNEENTRFFWRGTAIQYVQLLKASYRAVKLANPKALVVFGGTAHNDAGWVQKCYRSGARGYFDVMATHPYPHLRWHKRMGVVIGSIYKVRNVMVANHDSQTPVWFTEYGWSRSAFSPQNQARLLHKSLVYIASRLPYVQESFWYEAKTEDPSSMQNKWLSGLSLLTPAGEGTPAFKAMAKYAGLPEQN